MSSTALAISKAESLPAAPAVFNVPKMLVLAEACAKSGFYKDVNKDASKALVKMMTGHELGFGPSASITGIYIVQDKIVLSYPMLAALVKRSGRYDYRVKSHTNDACVVEFYEFIDGKRVLTGTSPFTMDDANKAGLLSNPTWKKYPRNMLFARALSNGQKWYAPDVSCGTPIYTPDEMGIDEEEDGTPIFDAPKNNKKLPVLKSSPKTSKALSDELLELIKDTGAEEETLLRHYGVGSISELGDDAAGAAIKLLKVRREAKAEVTPSAN